MDFKKLAKNLEDEIVNWRRDPHQIPEVELDLPETREYISQVLTEIGIKHEIGLAESGVVGLISGGAPGPTFAIRSDMDALAVTEETGLEFASQHEGRMHACGHDSHMAMTLGAAKILHEHRDKLKGNVKLIFQPAEEGPGGAKPMIEAGALQNPDVEAIIGLHNGQIFAELEKGQIGVKTGPTMACLDSFEIEVIGKGGHGAKPDLNVDPITISASIIQELQTLISREISPVRPGVISVCKIHGGTAYNITPDKVKLSGTARFIHEEERKKISRRLEELVTQVAQSRKAEVDFTYNYGYPPLFNPEEFTKFFQDTARDILTDDDIIELQEPAMVGEDMAYFLQEVPGTYFFLGGIKEDENGEQPPHHSSRFDVDESVFWLGAALLSKTAYKWLQVQ